MTNVQMSIHLQQHRLYEPVERIRPFFSFSFSFYIASFSYRLIDHLNNMQLPAQHVHLSAFDNINQTHSSDVSLRFIPLQSSPILKHMALKRGKSPRVPFLIDGISQSMLEQLSLLDAMWASYQLNSTQQLFGPSNSKDGLRVDYIFRLDLTESRESQHNSLRMKKSSLI